MASVELQTVINLIRSRPVPETPPTFQERRAGMESTAAPVPNDVTVERVDAGGVAADWVSAPGADDSKAVLYLHGGGYVIGSAVTHRELASRISRTSGARVLVVDYRLAPEHPFPAAVDDAVAAYRWMLAQGIAPENSAVAGDSAGGGLAIATLIALRDGGDPLPATAVCLSPWVDVEMAGDSMTSRAELDPMVQKPGLSDMAAAYLGGADPKSPLASPLHANLAGLPPLLIMVGTSETLLDDSVRFVERARDAGVEVIYEPWEDMIHVWPMFGMMPEANQATDRIGAFLQQHVGA